MNQLTQITNMVNMMTPAQKNKTEVITAAGFLRQSEGRMPAIERRMRRRNRSNRH